jgi:hypothetical protein
VNDVTVLFLSGNLEAQYFDSSLYFLTSKHEPKVDLEIANVRYDLFWQILDSVEGHTLIFADTSWIDSGARFLLERFTQFGKKDRINSYFSSADGFLTLADDRLTARNWRSGWFPKDGMTRTSRRLTPF